MFWDRSAGDFSHPVPPLLSQLETFKEFTMSDTHRVKVLIIGAGPAGFTAAIYAARANLEPMLVAGLQPGGQLMITTDVENYPGYEDVIQGPWLMDQMQKQAEKVGTDIRHDLITEVDFTQRPLRAVGDSGSVYLADTIIIATGAQARWLGLPAEQKFMGFGVSACATCDGFFYRGKEVAVIGGGNTAVLVLRNVKTDAKSELPVHGMFVAIGHDPATAVFKGHIEMDEEGYIVTAPDSTATDIPGVFAAGDVKDKTYRQAVTAAGMGCMAALEAEKFVAGLEDGAASEAAE